MKNQSVPPEGRSSEQTGSESALHDTPCCPSFSSVEEEEEWIEKMEAWLDDLRNNPSVNSIWEYMAFVLDWKFRENGVGRVTYSEIDSLASFTLYFGNTHFTLQAIEGVPCKVIFVGKYGILNKRDFVDRIDRKLGVMVKAHEALIAARQKREETVKVREALAKKANKNRSDVRSDNAAADGASTDDGSPVVHSDAGSSSILDNVKGHAPLADSERGQQGKDCNHE